MKVLIVGGGIAGLSLAGFLEKKGIVPTLIEKEEKWETMGFVIAIWSNGLNILKKLGLEKEINKHGVKIPDLTIKNAQNKTVFFKKSEDWGEAYEFEREKLHEILRKGIKKTKIRMDTQIESLKQKNNKVIVKFSNNKTEEFDLVVGADGINSQTRHYIKPKRKKEYSGFTFWYYWVNKNNYKFPKGGQLDFNGNRSVMTFATRNKNRLAIYFTMPAKEHQFDNIKQSDDFIKEHFSKFKGAVSNYLKNIPKDPFYIYHHNDERLVLKKWYKNRIVLIGDAIHATSPMAGLGASSALEDAYVLAEELSKTPIDKALPKFKKRRFPKVKYISKISDLIHRGIKLNKYNWIFKFRLVSNLFLGTYFRKVRKAVEWDFSKTPTPP